MARVKALRAEQRSLRDIAAILNTEGMTTLTGQEPLASWDAPAALACHREE
jgi:hypothetical protein